MVNRRGFLSTMLTPALARAASKPTQLPAVLSSALLPAWPDDNDPDFWAKIRDQFYFPPGEAFFNTGTIGAVSRAVLECWRFLTLSPGVESSCRSSGLPNLPMTTGAYR